MRLMEGVGRVRRISMAARLLLLLLAGPSLATNQGCREVEQPEGGVQTFNCTAFTLNSTSDSARLECTSDTSWHDVVDAMQGLPHMTVKDLRIIRCPFPTGLGPIASLLRKMGSQPKDLRHLTISRASGDKSLLSSHLLDELTRLEGLDMSGNGLKMLPRELQRKISNSIDLSVLNLANNQFDKQIIFMHRMDGLKTLDLSHNRIGNVINSYDINFMHVDHVDLSFNNISELDLSHGHKTGWPTTLNLAGNPLACDCWTVELHQQLAGNLAAYKDMFQPGLRCDPGLLDDTLAGHFIIDVPTSALLCPFPSDTFDVNCTANCHCSLDRAANESVVDCRHQGLTALPDSLPLVPRQCLGTRGRCGHSGKVRLDMTGNKLVGLGSGAHNLLENVTSLILTNNSIKDFNHATLPTGLKLLALDGNELKSITYSDKDFFDKITKIWLGRNPWDCSCAIQPLSIFLRNSNGVQDRGEIKPVNCGAVERNITHFDEEVCKERLSSAAIGGAAATILLLVAACAGILLWTFHRKSIAVWIFSKLGSLEACKPCLRCLFPYEIIDQDMRYDAFISYAREDREDEKWVLQVLLPGLEGSGWRCYVPQRDLQVGGLEMDPGPIESSRRMIVVLSQAYAASPLCMEEFQLAHRQALQDTVSRVRVIVRGGVPGREELEEDLFAYIHLNTYLEDGDPAFWNKLRYAMPHRDMSTETLESSWDGDLEMDHQQVTGEQRLLATTAQG